MEIINSNMALIYSREEDLNLKSEELWDKSYIPPTEHGDTFFGNKRE